MFEMLLGGKAPISAGSIKKAMAGGADLLALSESGKLYGICSTYLSGTGTATTTWTKILDDVEDFWAGFRQCLAKMKDGRWLFWGTNSIRISGITSGGVITTPTDVSAAFSSLNGQTIKSLVLSSQTIAVVLTDGRYAILGANGNGGCATGNTTAVTTMTIKTDYTNVAKVALAPVEDTTYLLLSDGTIIGCGQSLYGQLNVTGQSSITSWRTLVTAAGALKAVDLIATYSGWFNLREDPTYNYIYAQGRQFDGSLGTGQTAATNVSSQTLVSKRAVGAGPLEFYVGTYSFRFRDPATGEMFFSGTGSAAFGFSTGAAFPAGTKYVPTKMPSNAMWGPLFATVNGYTAVYLNIEGNLFGAGSPGSSGLLPGYTSAQTTFVPLDTGAVV
ncbi:hypothetical protein [Cronobacter phage EspYZU12]|nr:hypothetical protein EspYZU15_163 [Cronobacter phage EspYZU15]WAK45569.1 hypothetical protein EspYZU14_165 [Cronobacter phage EspYZU14]WBF78353.1 hypothetical protein [Cronobacter phage EspYZU12]